MAAPLKAATLEQMAGQMIMVGFTGNGVSDSSIKALRAIVAEGGVGGVMYLKFNVQSLAAVKAMNDAFTAAAPDLPPFIALDQEGGSIERLTSDVGFREIPSAANIARAGTPQEAEPIYRGMAAGLSALGFNLNFAPVVDLNINPDNPIIARYGRSFGREAQKVADYASAFITAHHREKVLTVLKHFPGHGSSESDSHAGFVDITKTWQADELEPYRMLITKGLVDMVMVGHLFHQKFTADAAAQPPASLSPAWITGVLRHQLGFDGVVISDDLEMSAIREHFGFRAAILRAVNAGTDILLFSNTVQYHIGLAGEVRDILVQEAERDPAFKARIAQSYARILALKQRLDG